MNESQIERDIVQYIRMRGFLVLRTHDSRHKPVEEGIPDLLVYGSNPWRHTWVEVKMPKGKLSPAQAEMHAALTERGARVIVARSVADVEKL
jgi:Holliday junction resolvase